MGKITPVITHLGVKPAPLMAAFSSKGPNRVTPGILKVLSWLVAKNLVIIYP